MTRRSSYWRRLIPEGKETICLCVCASIESSTLSLFQQDTEKGSNLNASPPLLKPLQFEDEVLMQSRLIHPKHLRLAENNWLTMNAHQSALLRAGRI
jgi:hypothetical protein